MAILEEEVWVLIGGNNVGHYESLGYEIPRRRRSKRVPINKLTIPQGTKILVKVEDLPKVSTVKVTKICDDCGLHVLNQEYGVVLNRRGGDGKDRCHKCGKINGGHTRKNKIIYKKSFELFVKENNMAFLLEEYSSKNNKSPKELSYGTEEIVWWNCPECESEYDMKLNNRTLQDCNCPYCAGRRVNHSNCIWTTHLEIAKLLKNPQRGYEITAGSGKYEEFVCTDCGHTDIKKVADVTSQGYSCPQCSDGISYPEKFIYNMISQLNIKVERQKIFKWSKNIHSENKRLKGTKKYDFYLPDLDCIIEAHGDQHYNTKFKLSDKSLKDEQDNDALKEYLAKQNDIKYYVVINCSKSELEFIKNNVINSILNDLYCLENIDWDECHKYALSSIVKPTCLLWDVYGSVSEISEVTGIDKSTVRKYLTQGSKIGFCNYNGQDEARKTRKNNLIKINEIRSVKVVQFTDEGEFLREWDSLAEAQNQYNINNIATVCRGRQKTAGGFIWMYKDDYEKQEKENGNIAVSGIRQKIIQLSLDGEFIKEHKNAIEAAKSVGRDYNTNIIKCCKNSGKAYGFRWMYKCEYNKLISPKEII